MTLFKPTINDAYVVSVISLLATITAFIVGMILSIRARSASTLGYALENFVDTLSSILVVWRFWGGGKTISPEKLILREKRASIAIAITFIFLAIAIVTVAGIHLTEETKPEDAFQLMMISIPSVVIFGVLGCIKLWFGGSRNLSSPALVKDGVCSICGAFLSLTVLFSATLQYIGHEIWWVDGAFAVIISAALLFVGMSSVRRNIIKGNQFWTVYFWTHPSDAIEAMRESDDMSLIHHNIENSKL